jgi:sugar phosphate isomerase/epimerase
VDWRSFLRGVKESGYAGPVVIEFEDKAYEGSYDDVVKGMLLARDHIKERIEDRG